MPTNQWPESMRPVLDAVLEHLGYTAMDPVRDLSGAAGAITRLCRAEGPHGRANTLVVKVGPADLMGGDIDGLRAARSYFRDAAQALADAQEVASFTCIPLRLVGTDVVTLEDHYDAADPATIGELIDELFLEVLRLPQLTVRPTSGNTFALYRIWDDRRLAAALREAGDPAPGLLNWWRHASQALAAGSYTRLCHGDMHGRNVLVSADPRRVFVVDFGQTGEHHALRDLAKLEREIHLTLLGGSHAGRWAPSAFPPVDLGQGVREDAQLTKASTAITRIRELARRFMPQDADVEREYAVALLAQFMFAAANPELPLATRRAARLAAERIQAELVARFPALALPDDRRREIAREETLWRFIYTFARLDQQPGGSWSRSIVQWMNAIWADDHDHEIYRDPNMRRRGGTDLTCYAVDGLVQSLRAQLTPADTAEVLVHNEAVRRAFRELAGKIGFKGGIGTGMSGTAAADVKIRHTAMTVIAALRYRQGHDGAVAVTNELRRCLTYLAESLSHWSIDRAFPFGMTMSCVKLAELLGTDLVDHLEPALVADVRARLEQELPSMIEALESQPDHVRYLPPPARSCEPRPPFFQPYCNFWRMERSGFLMYVGFAVREDGRALIDPVGKYLGRRFVQCFNELLVDVAPFDPATPEASLIRFHRGDESVPRDWGLSGELAALLELPAVQELVANGDPARRRDLDRKRSALRAALLATFDGYSARPSVFAFTQGAMLLRAWQVFGSATVTRRDLDALDASIDRLRNQPMTEWDLDRHVREFLVHPVGDRSAVDADSVRKLLVAKLESGEYIESDAAWEAIASKAAALDPRRSPTRWRPSASDPTIAQLRSLLGQQATNVRQALDVGEDGDPGAFGDHLAGWGFNVARLRLSAPDAGTDVLAPEDGAAVPSTTLPDGTYDAVTVGEALLRVPKGRVPAVCRELHRLTRPGGVLVVRVRTKDHALIDMRGRFVQYYRDETALRRLLEDVGFENLIVLQSGTSPRVSLFAHKPTDAAQPE